MECLWHHTLIFSTMVQHPFHDRRTIRIPPQVYANLSGSQKQFWDIKSKYMDVLLFFKVGTFYELYENDAQAAHDVLDWKMTITGVGHCRQVGCPEKGLPDAEAALVAAGATPRGLVRACTCGWSGQIRCDAVQQAAQRHARWNTQHHGEQVTDMYTGHHLLWDELAETLESRCVCVLSPASAPVMCCLLLQLTIPGL
jgi:hypothetical protein